MNKFKTRSTKMTSTKYSSFLAVVATCLISITGYSQKEWEAGGEIEDVEIEIVKERQITLPKANRNFEKIPPRPSETIKNPIKYDFQAFNFSAPLINPAIKPLKLKQESDSKIYGGFVRAGYGNYASPLLEAYINSRKDKNKLIGAHFLHNSSDRGPVDGKNSGNGNTSLSVFGKSFNESIALSGSADFDNRTTHFYGYPAGAEVDPKKIKQSYTVFKLAGDLSNTKNSDFAYKLGAGFNYLTDKYEARESEIDLDFSTAYTIDDDSRINLKAGYYLISRKDAEVEATPRNLFTVTPSYEFMPIEDLRLSIGATGAYENDTLGSKDVHVYPNLKASYPVSPSVDFVASLTGGIEKVSLQSISYENIWINSNIPIAHVNKLYDLNVGINAKVGNKVSANAGLSFASLKNMHFFVNNEADPSRFDVIYEEGFTRRSNLYAALGYAQTETVKFMLRGDVFSYDTENLPVAWHLPTYKLSAGAAFNIYEKLLLNVDFITRGGMKALAPVTRNVVTLDPALDLNVKTEYMFSKSVSMFVQFNNIFSNQYPAFLNYPVRGFQFTGGVTWSF
jgi:hypothetical protein